MRSRHFYFVRNTWKKEQKKKRRKITLWYPENKMIPHYWDHFPTKSASEKYYSIFFFIFLYVCHPLLLLDFSTHV